VRRLRLDRIAGGGLIAVGGLLYVFTDDHAVHCINPATMGRCGLYDAGGEPSGLNKLGFAPLDPGAGVSGSNIDRVVDETTGRIYHTLHIRDTAASAVIWTPGVYLDCWDTTIADTCPSFTPRKIHDVVQRQAGRLFLHRTSDGDPDGVCSTGVTEIRCVDFFGNTDAGLEAAMSPLTSELPAASEYTNGMGVHTYHPDSNRLILTSPRQVSTVLCWDFEDDSFCGDLYGFANGNETQDYGFVAEGPCLYGLGHNSIFWAFTADMTPGCPGATVETDIDVCDCGGEDRWGLVSFNFDIGDDSPFVVVNARAVDQNDDQVWPTNGDRWVSMIGLPGNTLDLSEVPTTLGTVTVQIYVETDGSADPWDAADSPAILIGFRERPHLVN